MSQTKVQLVEGKSDQTITGSTLTTTTATTTTLNAANLNSGAFSNRNIVINGNFSVDQRNNGNSVDLDAGGTSAYAADRFVFFNYGAGELDTDVQRIDNDAPEGFKYANKLTVTTPESSGGTPAADDRLSMQYRAEAYSTDHFDFGQSTAKNFYISFWVKSSLTGNFGLALIGGGKSYCVLYPISSANTWEKIKIKVPGPTSGSWLQGTNASIELKFGLYSGSNRVGPDQGITGTGSWQSGDSPQGTTGQVQLGGTNGATWLITGLQMEAGDTATEFEHRSYGDEYLRCCRYYYRHTRPGKTYAPIGSGTMYTDTTAPVIVFFPTEMRYLPTVESVQGTGYYEVLAGGTADQCDRIIMEDSNDTCSGVRLDTNLSISSGQGRGAYARLANTSSGYLSFSAEL